jgi:hypothetical protein
VKPVVLPFALKGDGTDMVVHTSTSHERVTVTAESVRLSAGAMAHMLELWVSNTNVSQPSHSLLTYLLTCMLFYIAWLNQVLTVAANRLKGHITTRVGISRCEP